MKFFRHSYRFAQEILNDSQYTDAWVEIQRTLAECPLYIWPNKSKNNNKLDVVQQLLNVYFERRLHLDLQWSFHPDATAIPGSKLKADFRKSFGDLVIQAEVQFGNMSRWYSDVFKFQAGYSGQQVRMGISILPTHRLGVRIDSNVAHYERAIRELPAAEFSITLPILTLGIEPDTDKNSLTPIIDVSTSKFTSVGQITGRGMTRNRWRIVNNLLNGIPIHEIGPNSDLGPWLEDGQDDDC
jgi:hypothetical protein